MLYCVHVSMLTNSFTSTYFIKNMYEYCRYLRFLKNAITVQRPLVMRGFTLATVSWDECPSLSHRGLMMVDYRPLLDRSAEWLATLGNGGGIIISTGVITAGQSQPYTSTSGHVALLSAAAMCSVQFAATKRALFFIGSQLPWRL